MVLESQPELQSPSETQSQLIESLYRIRLSKAALDKTERLMLGKLKPLVDPQFDMRADLGIPVSETVIHSGDLELSRVQGTNRTISAEKLLERGVNPEIVNYATKTVSYFQYRIRGSK